MPQTSALSEPHSPAPAPGPDRHESPGATPLSPQQAWAVVAVVWTLYVLVLLLDVGEPTHVAIKALLMPSLVLWVVAAVGSGAPGLLAAGLVAATVGDVGVSFEPPVFLVGMAGFLGMQLAYSAGFLRMGAWPAVRKRWPVPTAYLGLWSAANLVLGPRLGELRVPVLVYSLALCTTAALSAGLDRRMALGGFLFLASDLLLGLRKADLDFRGSRIVVDTSYLASQALIASGWVRRTQAPAPDAA
jgi:uncharacterized membrane protein YhhN